MDLDDDYRAGARIAFSVVGQFKVGEVEFRFPPRNVALFADLNRVGHKLAINEQAHKLVDLLIEKVREGTGRIPTALMLQGALEYWGHETKEVDVTELDLPPYKIVSPVEGDSN